MYGESPWILLHLTGRYSGRQLRSLALRAAPELQRYAPFFGKKP